MKLQPASGSDCMILLIFGYLCFTRSCSNIVGVVCMPMRSKFLMESTGEKIVKIGQYLAKIFFGPPCSCSNSPIVVQ